MLLSLEIVLMIQSGDGEFCSHLKWGFSVGHVTSSFVLNLIQKSQAVEKISPSTFFSPRRTDLTGLKANWSHQWYWKHNAHPLSHQGYRNRYSKLTPPHPCLPKYQLPGYSVITHGILFQRRSPETELPSHWGRDLEVRAEAYQVRQHADTPSALSLPLLPSSWRWMQNSR